MVHYGQKKNQQEKKRKVADYLNGWREFERGRLTTIPAIR